MQIFEKDKVAVKKTTIEVLNSLLTLGVSIEQANEYLGTQFEIEQPEEDEEDGQTEGGQGSASEEEGSEGEGAEGATDKNILICTLQ